MVSKGSQFADFVRLHTHSTILSEAINVTFGRMLLKRAQVETQLLQTQPLFTSSKLTIVKL